MCLVKAGPAPCEGTLVARKPGPGLANNFFACCNVLAMVVLNGSIFMTSKTVALGEVIQGESKSSRVRCCKSSKATFLQLLSPVTCAQLLMQSQYNLLKFCLVARIPREARDYSNSACSVSQHTHVCHSVARSFVCLSMHTERSGEKDDI